MHVASYLAQLSRQLRSLGVLDALNQPACLLKSATVTLTDAQIKALPTTPVDVVPAQGSGKGIVPVAAMHVLRGPTGYSGGGVTPKVSLQTPYSASLTYGWEIVASGTPPSIGLDVMQGRSDGPDNFDNQPLQVFAIASGNFTGGDPANTLKVTVFYVVVDL